jgi:MoaA/NifB/PqqE/SkfB family radical SAM enzyme
MANVGDINVGIGADSSGLQKGIKDAQSRIKSFQKDLRQKIATVAKYTAGLAAAGAALTAALVKRGLDAIDAQAKLARSLDGTIDGLRGLQLAGSDAGVETGQLNKSVETLNARLGEAQRGGGSAAEALQRLGLDARELSRMDVDERMATIADRMKDMRLSTAQAGDELKNLGIGARLHIRRAMLSVEQLKQVMVDLDRMGTFEITLTGGEPSMRKGFWSLIDVVPTLKHASVTLITNAANLRKDQMDRIVDSGIRSIRVSMDGTRETFEQVRLVDAFDTVVENSVYLRDRVDSFKVLTTVMKTNLHNVLDLTAFLRAHGFTRQDQILVRAHGRGGRNRLLLTEQETMDLYARVRDFRLVVSPSEFDLNLNAPYLVPGEPISPVQDVVMFPYVFRDSSVAVSATGDVTMSRLYSPAPLGNTKDLSFEEIWRLGQEQLVEEQEAFDEAELRRIFWDFAGAEKAELPVFTSLLDRQIFEGYAVR